MAKIWYNIWEKEIKFQVKGEFIMWLNALSLTEEDIKESCERMVSSGPIVTDMSDYYSDKLYEIHKGHTTQQQDTIFGIPLTEVERQCHASQIDSPFDQSLDPSQDPVDTVIEGGEKILNNQKTLKLARNIYRQDNK